jgi:glutathione S-transferase
MSELIVHGIPGSPFVRSVLAACEEKGQAWRLAALAPGQSKAPEHLVRHPFGRVPAVEHDGYALYESQAILRYLDALIPSPALQPKAPQAIGRMNQVIGIADWYFFPSATAGIGFERIIKPAFLNLETDLARVEASLPLATICIDELERLLGDQAFLAGDTLTLADLIVGPQMSYFRQTPEGAALLAGKRLAAWIERMEARPSFQATQTERLMQPA